MRIKWWSYCILFACCLLGTLHTRAQDVFANIIQINGVTMTADSLRAVPNVTVVVKNKNRGVESGASGVFSLVCTKGDTLQFTSLGYRYKEFVIDPNIKGRYFSMIQLMVQDTFYLPATVIRGLPGKDGFGYAFRHWQIPDDKYEIARRNTDALTLRALAYTTPRDGRENQAAYQNIQAHEAVYYGQRPPMNILNPLAWADFYEAWKRGDFRNQQLQ